MYFSIAVILIYGISIAMLVAASTLRRSHSDYELKSFMRSYSRLDVERRSREKQRVRAVLKRLHWLSPPSQSTSGIVSVASAAAPHSDISVGFPAPSGSPNVRPVRLPGLGSRTPTASTWPDRSPPTVSVVDVSAMESCHGDDDDERVIRDAVRFGSNSLLHHHHQLQLQGDVKIASHHVSRLPRPLSERSLLMPKCISEFDVTPSPTRRNTAV